VDRRTRDIISFLLLTLLPSAAIIVVALLPILNLLKGLIVFTLIVGRLVALKVFQRRLERRPPLPSN
jgi:uncharacterized protein YneF (UPF0154 family)